MIIFLIIFILVDNRIVIFFFRYRYNIFLIDFESFDYHSFIVDNFAIDNFTFDENRLSYYFVAKIAIAIENLTCFDFVTIFAQ